MELYLSEKGDDVIAEVVENCPYLMYLYAGFFDYICEQRHTHNDCIGDASIIEFSMNRKFF